MKQGKKQSDHTGMKFDAVLTYNYSTKKFSGRYINEWNTGLKCANTLVIEREEK